MAVRRGLWAGKRGVLIGVLAVLLIIAGASAWWFWSNSGDSGSAGPTPAAAPRLTQPQADELAAQLGDPEPARVAEALTEDAAAAFLESPAPLVPPGATLTIDAASFTQTGDVDAVVAATVSGAQSAELVLYLGLEAGEWHVISSSTV
ncbi:hypothetical protein [Geodermatophilus sp. URMC 64]